ncbi:secreted phosphoprotein 24-like [Sinocyclocheilus rhinocerous]|uniref:secreted phosphoprotein 24-like n=1 Tax=Sinocyclocheilus rhinocerous TaxID=307959 RepID=UPI0007B8D99B|nr:PREDICTED: secreted phosphoprotein 24-like [Sinocyclocheilus rhinocerous]
MTPAYILLLFFQCCCVSGQLGNNFSHLANLALKVSVDKVNRQSSNFNLHRPTSSVVRKITLGRDNTYDILLDFGIKETVCLKYTRRPYRNRCHFKQGRLASKKLCSSLVRVGSISVAPLGISCLADTATLGSSSESSSEEVIIRRIGRVPLGSLSSGIILCRGEFNCSRLLL